MRFFYCTEWRSHRSQSRALAHVGMTWLLSLPSVGAPTLHRVGRAGHGRHGGEAPALCVGSVDVGLELLVLLTLSNLRFLSREKDIKKTLKKALNRAP